MRRFGEDEKEDEQEDKEEDEKEVDVEEKEDDTRKRALDGDSEAEDDVDGPDRKRAKVA